MSVRHGAKTDLPELKLLAKSLLYMEPEQTEFSPIIVHHPFTTSGIVGLKDPEGNLRIGNIMENPEDRTEWQKQMEKIIDGSKNALSIYHLIEKPYVLGFLKFAAPNLSKADFSTILADAWIRSEQPNHDPNLPQSKLLAMFRQLIPRFSWMIKKGKDWMPWEIPSLCTVVFILRNPTALMPCPGPWIRRLPLGLPGGMVGRDVCTKRKLRKPISARCSWGEMNPR